MTCKNGHVSRRFERSLNHRGPQEVLHHRNIPLVAPNFPSTGGRVAQNPPLNMDSRIAPVGYMGRIFLAPVKFSTALPQFWVNIGHSTAGNQETALSTPELRRLAAG